MKITKITIPFFYINLDRSTDRKKIMEHQLQKYSINYTRISAIDGNNLNINIQYKIYNKINNCELACLLSHIKTILEIEKKGYKYGLILEDDIDFKFINKWEKSIKQIIKNAPKDWNIIKLHHSNYNLTKTLYKSNIKYIKDIPVKINWSTGAYIINKKGIQELKSNFLKDNIWTFKPIRKYKKIAADKIIYDISNVYNYTKPLFLTNKFKLTILNHKEINDEGYSKIDNITNYIVTNYYHNLDKNVGFF